MYGGLLQMLKAQETELQTEHWTTLSQAVFEQGVTAPSSAADKAGILTAADALLATVTAKAATNASELQARQAQLNVKSAEVCSLQTQRDKVRPSQGNTVSQCIRSLTRIISYLNYQTV